MFSCVPLMLDMYIGVVPSDFTAVVASVVGLISVEVVDDGFIAEEESVDKSVESLVVGEGNVVTDTVENLVVTDGLIDLVWLVVA